MTKTKNTKWQNSILGLISARPIGSKFFADDIRQTANARRIIGPSSPAQWGVLFYAAANKYRLIQKTGRCAGSALKSAHCRLLPEWERVK